MKFFQRLLTLLLVPFVLHCTAQSQSAESLRGSKWLHLQKLLFKKAAASWSLSETDKKELQVLLPASPFAACARASTVVCTPSVMPVAGLILKGQRTTGGKVLLAWETQSEYHTKGFVLERKADVNASIFDSIFYTEGAGTTYSKRKYDHIDLNDARGSTFYRVKQFDYDRYIIYSNTLEIKGVNGEFTISIVPNPATSYNVRLYFNVPSQRQIIDFTVLNAAGIQLFKKEKYAASTGYFDLGNIHLLPGYYFITVHTLQSVITKSFIITH